MEQRRLRLGDTLDDYCPRERRVTNHAVVAMIEEDVKQTRCTTCDAEHAYKGGREPRRRKKDTTSALYREVLADMPEAVPPPAPAAPETEAPVVSAATVSHLRPTPVDDPVVEDEPIAGEQVEEAVEPVEEGPVHRQLIRATLPRPEGQKEVRQMPDFTIRNNNGGRGGHFRGDRSQRAHGTHGNGSGNGNRPQGRRFSGGNSEMPGRGGAGRGAGAGFRGANSQPRHGGKKRSR